MAESKPANFLVNVCPQPDQSFYPPVLTKLLNGSDGAIHAHPSHHLGVHEMAAGTPYLPDAIVRLCPDFLELQHQCPLQIPCRLELLQAATPCLIKSIQDFAIDVQLQLFRGG